MTKYAAALTRWCPAPHRQYLDGLDPFAPDEKAPAMVAERIRSFLWATS
jgi:hypothetical protein